jgi:hypothetical protein
MNLLLVFRPPLLWLVVAETIVVLATGLLAWHTWESRQVPLPPAVAQFPGAFQPPPSAAAPSAPPGSRSQPVATPGIATDPAFLGHQLTELNRVEASFESLEWRVTKAIADAIQAYADRVVLPSIDRAEADRR